MFMESRYLTRTDAKPGHINGRRATGFSVRAFELKHRSFDSPWDALQAGVWIFEIDREIIKIRTETLVRARQLSSSPIWARSGAAIVTFAHLRVKFGQESFISFGRPSSRTILFYYISFWPVAVHFRQNYPSPSSPCRLYFLQSQRGASSPRTQWLLLPYKSTRSTPPTVKWSVVERCTTAWKWTAEHSASPPTLNCAWAYGSFTPTTVV